MRRPLNPKPRVSKFCQPIQFAEGLKFELIGVILGSWKRERKLPSWGYIEGLGFRAQGLGFRAEGLGLRVYGKVS